MLGRVKAETAAIGRGRNNPTTMDIHPEAIDVPGTLQMRGTAMAAKGSKQAPSWHMSGLQFKHM
jgi:hypothetical protein